VDGTGIINSYFFNKALPVNKYNKLKRFVAENAENFIAIMDIALDKVTHIRV
jgi:hypothetical protein